MNIRYGSTTCSLTVTNHVDNNSDMSDMFPKHLNHSNINIRNFEKYHVNHASTERYRYRNSAIQEIKMERHRLKALLQVNLKT